MGGGGGGGPQCNERREVHSLQQQTDLIGPSSGITEASVSQLVITQKWD